MSEEEKKDLLLVVENGTGRQIIGEEMEWNDKTITLKNPLLILERVMQPQQQQQQTSGQQIILNISPIMHTFAIDTWEFKWSGVHKITDQKLKDTYGDFLTQIRASRSNISLSRSMPTPQLVQS